MNDDKKVVAIYDHNPFIEPMLYKTEDRAAYAGNVSIRDANGEAHGPMLMDTRIVDEDEFVKLYNKSLMLLTEVGKAALQLFNTLIDSVEINADTLNFSPETYAESSGKSKSQVYRLVRELIDKKFIAKSTRRNVYFININLVCKGDRLTIINRYTRETEGKGIASTTEPKPIKNW